MTIFPSGRSPKVLKQEVLIMKYKIIVVGPVLLILFFLSPAVIAQYHNEEALQKAATELNDLIMCPICPGQTIAQSSNETSTQMRDLALKKLRQGETKEEVLQYFESRYGERIMAKPNKKGLNLMLWFLPFLLVALLVIGIYYLIQHWSKRGRVETVTHVDEARLGEYKERLEKELKEFDEGF
jgi:cytochrome c-type biogenesis protein CcmH